MNYLNIIDKECITTCFICNEVIKTKNGLCERHRSYIHNHNLHGKSKEEVLGYMASLTIKLCKVCSVKGIISDKLGMCSSCFAKLSFKKLLYADLGVQREIVLVKKYCIFCKTKVVRARKLCNTHYNVVNRCHIGNFDDTSIVNWLIAYYTRH